MTCRRRWRDFAAGADYRVNPDTLFGFALAGGRTRWNLSQGLGGGQSDAFQVGVYGATRRGPFYLAVAVAFAENWVSTDRFGPLGDHLTAQFEAPSLGARIEGGFDIDTRMVTVTPYAALQANAIRTPGYSETDLTGGGFALSYAARTSTDTRTELGVRLQHAITVESHGLVLLKGRLAWAHDWVSGSAVTAAFQTLPGSSFVVSGVTPASDSALVSAGAEYRLASGLSFAAKFDGTFAAHATTWAGTGSVRYSW